MKCRACGNQMRPGHLQACPGRTANGQPVIVSPAVSLGITFNDEPDPLEGAPPIENKTVELSFKPDIETIRRRAQRLLDDIATLGPDDAKLALQAECGAWTGDVVAEALAIKRGTEPIQAVNEVSVEEREQIETRLREKRSIMQHAHTEKAPLPARDLMQNHLSPEEVQQERTVEGIAAAIKNRGETNAEVTDGDGYVAGFKTSKAILRNVYRKVSDGNTGALSDGDLRRVMILGNIEAHFAATNAADKLAALRRIAKYTGLDERIQGRLAALKSRHAAYKKEKLAKAKEKDPDELLQEMYDIARNGEVLE